MRVAVIPARGGSIRIPRKNIRRFHGKPIIAYSIQAAKESGLFDVVVVSTEDWEVKHIAVQYGAFVVHRTDALAKNEVGTQEVMRDALSRLQSAEHACCIYAPVPMLKPSDLVHGFTVLQQTGARYAYVTGWYYWGRAQDFIERPQIEDSVCLDTTIGRRWVDINTEEDWMKAERIYAEAA